MEGEDLRKMGKRIKVTRNKITVLGVARDGAVNK